MISDRLLKILKVCFWLNIATFTGMIILNIVTIVSAVSGEIYQPNIFIGILIGIFELPVFFFLVIPFIFSTNTTNTANLEYISCFFIYFMRIFTSIR